MSKGHAHHGHDHHGHHGHHHRRGEAGRRLRWVLGVTAVFMVAEVVGGILSNSLALLADAGHMFTDVAALALSVFAMRVSQRPPTVRRTYGYARLEILAALLNGATLLLIAGLIVVEAWDRLRAPVEVDGVVMLSVATLGLGVNIFGAFMLHSHAHDNLNVRGAYLHVLGDLLGSIGAIAAGVIILTTGWTLADPIISVVIALLILVSAWNLVREATDVLLESAPAHIDMEAVLSALWGIDGLDEIHDVHVWTLTSGFVALSAHGVIDDPLDHNRVLEEVRTAMAHFGIEHVTFQIELRTVYQMGEELVDIGCARNLLFDTTCHVPPRRGSVRSAAFQPRGFSKMSRLRGVRAAARDTFGLSFGDIDEDDELDGEVWDDDDDWDDDEWDEEDEEEEEDEEDDLWMGEED